VLQIAQTNSHQREDGSPVRGRNHKNQIGLKSDQTCSTHTINSDFRGARGKREKIVFVKCFEKVNRAESSAVCAPCSVKRDATTKFIATKLPSNVHYIFNVFCVG
jgi:hypothetical protein